MSLLSRRDFLHDSAALTAALASAGLLSDSVAAAAKSGKAVKRSDANDQLNVAVIGVHGRGVSHVDGFAGRHNCVVTTICDADKAVIGTAMKIVEKRQDKPAKFVQDLR